MNRQCKTDDAPDVNEVAEATKPQMPTPKGIKITYENGLCKELLIDGKPMSHHCKKAELIMRGLDLPILRLDIFAPDVEVIIDGAVIETDDPTAAIPIPPSEVVHERFFEGKRVAEIRKAEDVLL